LLPRIRKKIKLFFSGAADPGLFQYLVFKSFHFRSDPYITGHVDQDIHVGPGEQDDRPAPVTVHGIFHIKLLFESSNTPFNQKGRRFVTRKLDFFQDGDLYRWRVKVPVRFRWYRQSCRPGNNRYYTLPDGSRDHRPCVSFSVQAGPPSSGVFSPGSCPPRMH
jgi:hypothetical protein